jgi:hypothetical protein
MVDLARSAVRRSETKGDEPVKILVCGGRNYADFKRVTQVLDNIHTNTPITILVHGGANGADTLADRWADEHNIPMRIYSAQWNKYGRSAGPRRNRQMIDEEHTPGHADKPIALVVAFPGGRGTAHMVRLARDCKIAVMEIK